MALLEVKNLTKNFGGLTAVGDVNIELGASELVGLIGPNGAGKTTLFNLLTNKNTISFLITIISFFLILISHLYRALYQYNVRSFTFII